MTMHPDDLELGEYVDETLPLARARALETHMASCARCRALTTDVATLRTAAGSLDRRNPSPDVWTRIAATVGQQDVGSPRWSFWTMPAAWRSAWATGVLVVVLGAATWLAWNDASTSQIDSAADTAYSASSGQGQNPADLLRDEISQLEPHVDSAFLPGEAKPSFEGALADIDDIIVRADTVRQEEPFNELAQQSLFEALRSKLTLLQEMLALINEMRKGNQEGTARIVSEMEP